MAQVRATYQGNFHIEGLGVGGKMLLVRGLLIGLMLVFASMAGCLEGSPSEDIHGEHYNGTPLANGNAGDFTLIDQDGENFTLSSLEGDLVVVSFIFTRCTDTCPLITSKLRQVETDLGDKMENDVHFVSVTLDPEYDTQERMSEYADIHMVDWPHLSGTREDLEQVWSNFGILVDRTFIESHTEVSMNHVSILYPDNSTELHGVMADMMAENSTGWNLTTMALNTSNVSLNYSYHEEWGHSVEGINGSDVPDDYSWWWKLYIWNMSNTVWEESSVGIDSLEVNEMTHIAWAANISDISALPDPTSALAHSHGHETDDNETDSNQSEDSHSHEEETGHEEVEIVNYTVGHNTITFILDEELDRRIAFLGDEWPAENLVGDVNTLLTEDGDHEDDHSTPAAGIFLSLVTMILAAIALQNRRE